MNASFRTLLNQFQAEHAQGGPRSYLLNLCPADQKLHETEINPVGYKNVYNLSFEKFFTNFIESCVLDRGDVTETPFSIRNGDYILFAWVSFFLSDDLHITHWFFHVGVPEYL